MSDTLKIGIVGCGMIGKSHLRAYSNIEEAEVIAIADVDEKEANKVAEEFGVSKVFADYKELLAINEIENVDVCLPNFLHSPVSVDALNAGKHVFCEKPMARNYEEASAMLEAAKANDRDLGVQVNTIFQPNARGAKRIINEGGLGHIYFAKLSNYRRKGRPWVDGYGTPHFVSNEKAGGGTLIDTGVYHFNRFLWLMDNPKPVTVSGATFQEMDVYEGRKDDIDVEEMAVGLIRFDTGLVLFVEDAWSAHMNESGGDVILGSKGGLKVDPLSFHSDMFGIESNTTFDTRLAEYHQNQYDENRAGYASPHHHWVYSLLGKLPKIPTGEIALNTVRISDAIYESAARGEEVKLA